MLAADFCEMRRRFGAVAPIRFRPGDRSFARLGIAVAVGGELAKAQQVDHVHGAVERQAEYRLELLARRIDVAHCFACDEAPISVSTCAATECASPSRS